MSRMTCTGVPVACCPPDRSGARGRRRRSLHTREHVPNEERVHRRRPAAPATNAIGVADEQCVVGARRTSHSFCPSCRAVLSQNAGSGVLWGTARCNRQQRQGVHYGCSLEPLDNPVAAKSLRHIISAGRVSRTRCRPRRGSWWRSAPVRSMVAVSVSTCTPRRPRTPGRPRCVAPLRSRALHRLT
jgi:hypothetical protein